MRKQIKKWGNAAGILFSAEDLKLYDLEIGDIVDLADMAKIGSKKKEKKKPTKKADSMDDVLKRMPQ